MSGSSPDTGLPALIEVLRSVHSALDRSLGDSDVTHIENDDELCEEYPVQWAAEWLARAIDDLEHHVPKLGAAQGHRPITDEMVEAGARAAAEAAGFAWESCAQDQWRRDMRAGLEAALCSVSSTVRVPKVRTSHHRNKEEAARLQELVAKRYERVEPKDHSDEECPNFPGCHCLNHCTDGWKHPSPEDGPVSQTERAETDDLRGALESLVFAVGNMKQPQTMADVALMMSITLGPPFQRAQRALAATDTFTQTSRVGGE